jgi:hypothetical protein
VNSAKLVELRALAMAATPGEWRAVKRINVTEADPGIIESALYEICAGAMYGPYKNKGRFHPSNAEYFSHEIDIVSCSIDRDYLTYEGGIDNELNAAYIAAANPATILALIARIEELEAYQKELWRWLHWSRSMLKPYAETAQIQSISDVLTKHGMPLSPSTSTEEGV